MLLFTLLMGYAAVVFALLYAELRDAGLLLPLLIISPAATTFRCRHFATPLPPLFSLDAAAIDTPYFQDADVCRFC